MTGPADLRAKLGALFSETLNVEVPNDETDLFESGTLDSLAFVELLFHLERTFGITTSVDDLEPGNFRTFSCIEEFVASRVGAGNGSPWSAQLKAKAG